jgi:endonuclease YncB( thermonuclease family)
LRRLDGLIAALLLIGLLALAVYLRQEESSLTGFATVIDGDSLRLEGEGIRLAGIDAPERDQSCSAERREYPCGKVARRALAEMTEGRAVTCFGTRRDRYGRRLGRCEVSGDDLGAVLVRRGLAVSYGSYWTEETLARRAKRGLWAGTFERPAEWRKTHALRER